MLEIGCGRGVGARLLLEELGATYVEAIDLDPLMVAKAAARLRGQAATVSTADMTSLPFEPAGFDAVVDFGAVHLESDWRAAVKEAGRVLRPGGRFFFEEIVGRAYRAVVPLATGRRVAGALTGPAWVEELRGAGFEMMSVRTSGPVALTGAVGDLIGVARLPRHSGHDVRSDDD